MWAWCFLACALQLQKEVAGTKTEGEVRGVSRTQEAKTTQKFDIWTSDIAGKLSGEPEMRRNERYRRLGDVPCDDASSCSACGPTSTTCLSCQLGYFLSFAQCLPCASGCQTCRSSATCDVCSARKYLDLSNRCQPCGLYCSACDGTHCLSCYDYYQVQSSEPQMDCSQRSCSAGTYRDENGYCQQCGGNCLHCSGPQSCDYCYPGFQQITSPAANCVLSACPPGTYRSPYGHCEACGSSCIECSSLFKCTICSSAGYIPKTGTNSCIVQPACSEGMFLDRETCTACGENCRSCSRAGLCDLCASGSHQSSPPSKDCIIGDCPVGTFRTETGHCDACGGNCEICSNYYSCDYCESGYKQETQPTTDCAQGNCLPGKYREDSGHCKYCGQFCDFCSGPSSCDVCMSNYQQPDGQSADCSSSPCHDGYYRDANGHCIACGDGCATCHSATECQTCTSPSNTRPKLGTNSCISAEVCSSSEYFDESCKDCGAHCLECSNSVSCDYCEEGYQQVGTQATCTAATCPAGTYRDGNGRCQRCGSHCTTCYNVESCSICDDGFQAADAVSPNCLSTACPAGKFRSTVGICEFCGSHCKLCSTETSCDQCSPGFQQENQPLVNCSSAQCSVGKYRDPSSGHCLACGLHCESCKDANTCEVCATGFQQSDDGRDCSATTCEAKKYRDLNGHCQNCGLNCAQCSSANSCDSCETGFTQQTPQKDCFDAICNPGTYRDEHGHCPQCGTNCGLCSNSASCDQCKYPAIQISQSENYCTEGECPSRYYRDPATGHCLPCGVNCQACDTQRTCTQCEVGYVIKSGQSPNCLDTFCDTGTYRSGNGHCFACGENCEKCSNASSCDTCKAGSYQEGESPLCTVGTCPVPQKYTDLNGKCQSCGASCAACVDAISCTTCTSGAQQLAPNRDCSTGVTCAQILGKSNVYRDPNGHCYECGANCLVCESSTKCLTCNANYQIWGNSAGSCTSNSCTLTPAPTYRDANGFCKPCETGCVSCSSADLCTACLLGYQIQTAPGICSATPCPSKPSVTYRDSNGFCKPCGMNCDNCPDAISCSKCASGFQQLVAGPDCVDTPCPEGKYRDTNGKCQNCGENCSKCSDAWTCDVCVANFQQATPSPSCSSAACPKGSYRDSNGHCPACGSSCAQCLDASICTSCEADYQQTAIGPNCSADPCPDGTFRAASGLCTDCINNCKFCPNGSICSACRDGFMKLKAGDKCFARIPCGDGSYQSGEGECAQCGASCSMCSDGESCDVCIAGFQQFPPSPDCLPGPCPSGKYRDTNGHCIACGSNCAACIDTTLCTICEVGFQQRIFPAGSCGAAACPVGKYRSDAGQCLACGEKCKSCNSATACQTCTNQITDAPYTGENKCVTTGCTTDQFWTGTSCSDCDLSCKGCFDSSAHCIACPNLYFPESNLPGACVKTCDFSCAMCYLSSTNCGLCETGYVPLGTLPGLCTNKCDLSCAVCSLSATVCEVCAPGYYFSGLAPGLCIRHCDPSCSACDGSMSKCVTCSRGFQPYTSLPGICVSADFCHESCAAGQCSGSFTSCASCAPGYQMSDSKCLFAVCHPSCATCIGGSYYDCLSCPSGAVLETALNMCLFRSCGGTCATCFGTGADQCLSCKANASLNADTHYCSCNLFFSLDPATKSCVYSGPCHETCATCDGPRASSCLSCTAKASLIDSSCVCIPSYTWINKMCAFAGTCSAECATCSGPKNSECLTCHNNASLAGANCICQANYLWNATTKTCEYTGMCANSCSTCSGPGENQCLSCTYSNSFLNPVTKACECEENYAWNGNFRICEYVGVCAEAFAACTGPLARDGTACDDNATKSGGACTCKANYSWHKLLGLCTAPQDTCHVSCVSCTGTTSRECAACSTANGHILQNGSCVCAAGYFGTVNSRTDQCISCHMTCKTCTDPSPSKCQSCYDHATLSTTRTCDCDAKYFLNAATARCETCHSTCATCSGPSSSECLTCTKPFVQSSSSCICPSGTFISTDKSTCQPCDSTCKACIGALSTQCTQCGDNMTLIDGTCACTQDGKYNHAGACSDCYEGCKTCVGPQMDKCLSCYSGSVLFAWPEPSACVCVAPKRPAPTPKVCGNCTAMCADCSKVDVNSCTVCRTNAVPALGSFPSACTCKPAHYLSSLTAGCEPCHFSCSSCASSSPFFCSVCASYSNEDGLYCEDYCPSNFAAQAGKCVATTPLVFSISFSSATNNTDAVNGYKTVRGSSTPTLPIVLYRQGLQLSGEQYAILPPNKDDSRRLLFSATHYAELWVRQTAVKSTQQTLLSKSVGSTSILNFSIIEGKLQVVARVYNTAVADGTKVGTLYMSALAKEVKVMGGDVPAGKTWVRVGYSTVLSGTGTKRATTIHLFVGDRSVAAYPVDGAYFFRDFSGTNARLLAGAESELSPGTNFVGQIAEISLYNAHSTPPAMAPCAAGCSFCTGNRVCLSSCASNEFETSTQTCTQCSPTCSSCMRASDCGLNLDPLCAEFTDFSGCTACKDLATMNKQGVCTCVEDSSFSEKDATCKCNPSFAKSSNQCLACLNYFKASEVSAIFDSSLLLVIVSFARPVAASAASCGDVFHSDTLARLGSSPYCRFDIDRKSLSVYLGKGATLWQEAMAILSKKVVSSQGTCATTSEQLAPVARIVGDLPKPVANIAAPGQFSTVCGSDTELRISGSGSTGAAGRPMLYKWAFVATPPTVFISGYSTYNETQSTITIPRSQLQSTSLSVTLTVKNAFGIENSQTKAIEILASGVISVSIEGGSPATIKTNLRAVFRAKVKTVCSGSAVNYDNLSFLWTLDSGASQQDLSSSHKSLTIPANSLKPGQYQFKVVVTDSTSNTSGSAKLDVLVTRGPLQAACDRSSGDQPQSKDLTIDCTGSYDTENPGAKDLAVKWTCTQRGGECTSATGMRLLLGTSLVITVPTRDLLPAAVYDFALTVSKDTRSDSASMSISIVEPTANWCKISSGKRRYSVREDIAIEANPYSSDPATFEWRKTKGGAIKVRSKPNVSFLSIPAGGAHVGESYEFLLTMTVGGLSLTAKVAVQISMGPTGGLFSVSPTSGNALVTPFTLTATGWETIDGNYPITSQFGYIDLQKRMLLTVPSMDLEYSTGLFAGELTLTALVCDSLGSCAEEQQASATVVPLGRELQTSNLVATFNDLTLDADRIPSVCTILGKSVTLEQSAWDYILDRLVSYSQDFDQVTPDHLKAELNCLQTLADVTPLQNSANLAALVKAATTVRSNCDDTMPSATFFSCYDLFSAYPITSEEDLAVLREYYSALQGNYSAAFKPNDTPLTQIGDTFSLLFARCTVDQLAPMSTEIGFPGFTLSVPESLKTDLGLGKTAVVDIYATQTKLAEMPAGMVDIRLFKAGTYWLKYLPGTATQLSAVEELSLPLNITLQMHNYSDSTEYQCVYRKNGPWRTGGCRVLSVTNTTVKVMVTRIGEFTVVPRGVASFHANSIPLFPIDLSEDCEQLLAPIYIQISIVVFPLMVVTVLWVFHCGKKPAHKGQEQEDCPVPSDLESSIVMSVTTERNPQPVSPRSDSPSESNSDIIVSVPADLRGGNALHQEDVLEERSAAFVLRVDANSGLFINVPGEHSGFGPVFRIDVPDSRFNTRATSAKSKQYARYRKHQRPSQIIEKEPEQPTHPAISFLEGHYLIGLFLMRQWPRWEKLLCLTTALTGDLLFLGVFYYYRPDSTNEGKEVSDWTLLGDYKGEDAWFYLYSCLLSLAVSGPAAVLFSIGEWRKDHRRVLWIGAGAAVCTIALIVFVVLVVLINLQVCFESAGKWSIGFLWSALTELLVFEFICAGVRFALLRITRA